MDEAASLTVDGRAVAEYVYAPSLPRFLAPRPYLHPVRTLGGHEVTDLMPDDHRHHLGVSVAVPDVVGANFWGGRTYVANKGSVLLPNHGVQRHSRWLSRTPDAVEHELCWSGPDGADLIREERRVAALPLATDRWALDFSFQLTNITTAPLAFASPATNGRPGAGYGGFFWRAPAAVPRVRVFAPDKTGQRGLHGRHAPWLAMTSAATGPRWTLIFIPADPPTRGDRWFVRAADYAGVGSALAWDRPLVVPSGAAACRRIITVVADGTVGATDAAAIVEAVTAAVTAG